MQIVIILYVKTDSPYVLNIKNKYTIFQTLTTFLHSFYHSLLSFFVPPHNALSVYKILGKHLSPHLKPNCQSRSTIDSFPFVLKFSLIYEIMIHGIVPPSSVCLSKQCQLSEVDPCIESIFTDRSSGKCLQLSSNK